MPKFPTSWRLREWISKRNDPLLKNFSSGSLAIPIPENNLSAWMWSHVLSIMLWYSSNLWKGKIKCSDSCHLRSLALSCLFFLMMGPIFTTMSASGMVPKDKNPPSVYVQPGPIWSVIMLIMATAMAPSRQRTRLFYTISIFLILVKILWHSIWNIPQLWLTLLVPEIGQRWGPVCSSWSQRRRRHLCA